VETVTSKQLKNETGRVLRMVRAGATVAVTNRGRRIAVIRPARDDDPGGLRETDADAWAGIEAALADGSPRHRTWQEAMREARGRP